MWSLSFAGTIICVTFAANQGKMKNIFLFIAFWALSLAGVTMTGQSSDAEDGGGVMQLAELSSSEDVCEACGSFLPLSERFRGDMTLNEAESLAHQLNVRTGRMLRLTSLQHVIGIKTLMRKYALLDNLLTHNASHYYTTLCTPSWEYASEHYIFGMRRILI